MNFGVELSAWYDRGDREAGTLVVERLARGTALPASFARSLGHEIAEEVEQEALVRLLDRDRRLLDGVDDPLAFAATVARNLARDALRRQRRRGDLASGRASTEDLQIAAPEAPSPGSQLDAERALALLGSLGEDGRLAVLLCHAPDRMDDSTWALVLARHPDSGPSRPEAPLDRDEASRLLWPPAVPETQTARRRRLERIRKVLARSYSRLAEELGAR